MDAVLMPIPVPEFAKPRMRLPVNVHASLLGSFASSTFPSFSPATTDSALPFSSPSYFRTQPELLSPGPPSPVMPMGGPPAAASAQPLPPMALQPRTLPLACAPTSKEGPEAADEAFAGEQAYCRPHGSSGLSPDLNRQQHLQRHQHIVRRRRRRQQQQQQQEQQQQQQEHQQQQQQLQRQQQIREDCAALWPLITAFESRHGAHLGLHSHACDLRKSWELPPTQRPELDLASLPLPLPLPVLQPVYVPEPPAQGRGDTWRRCDANGAKRRLDEAADLEFYGGNVVDIQRRRSEGCTDDCIRCEATVSAYPNPAAVAASASAAGDCLPSSPLPQDKRSEALRSPICALKFTAGCKTAAPAASVAEAVATGAPAGAGARAGTLDFRSSPYDAGVAAAASHVPVVAGVDTAAADVAGAVRSLRSCFALQLLAARVEAGAHRRRATELEQRLARRGEELLCTRGALETAVTEVALLRQQLEGCVTLLQEAQAPHDTAVCHKGAAAAHEPQQNPKLGSAACQLLPLLPQQQQQQQQQEQLEEGWGESNDVPEEVVQHVSGSGASPTQSHADEESSGHHLRVHIELEGSRDHGHACDDDDAMSACRRPQNGNENFALGNTTPAAVAVVGERKRAAANHMLTRGQGGSSGGSSGGSRNGMCLCCKGRQATSLALPCRHLVLCGTCESQTDACPRCGETKTAVLHVRVD